MLRTTLLQYCVGRVLQTCSRIKLATKPMTALRIRYANPELVEHILTQTGRRANLIAIVCHEILQHLGNRREITADDVEQALDSHEIHYSLGGWGNLSDENTTPSSLDRIIVYATIELEQFSLNQLWHQLDALDFNYQPTQVNKSLARLELAFILKRDKEQYRYRVPLFGHFLKTQGADKMLKDELDRFKREFSYILNPPFDKLRDRLTPTAIKLSKIS